MVYNRPNLIRSQVGSIATFGSMLQFRIFFFFFQLVCVFSSVQAKSKTEQCLCAFRYRSSARKRERECYNNLVLARVSGYIFMCICMFLCVYVFAKWCLFVSLSLCAGGEWGSVVCLCVEGPRCSPDFSWELQWSLSSAENSKSKPPTN